MEENKKELGMGWHNFLIFWLDIRGWLGIIIAAITIVTGFLAIELPAIAVGVLSVGVSVFALVTGERLKHLRKGAIFYLIVFYIVQFVVNLTDDLVAFAMDPSVGFGVSDSMWDAILIVVMLVINIPYYVKRKDMFTE